MKQLYFVKTKDDFKKFIKENAIKNRKDLNVRFPSAYYKFLKLSKEDKDELLPLVYNDHSSLVTKEDFIKFIKEHNVENRYDFELRFSAVYDKFLRLPEETRDEIMPRLLRNFSTISTKEDIKQFIEENNVTSRIDLFHRFQGIYKKFSTLLTEEEREGLLPSTAFNYFHLNTKEDFKIFIKDNQIVSRKDFYTRFRQAYYRFLKIFDNTEKEELLPSKAIKYPVLNSKEDFEKFIKDMNISSRTDMKRFSRQYEKFNDLLTDDEREEILPTNINDYSYLKTKDDFQKFIKENEVLGRKDFQVRFSGAYYRCIHDLSTEEVEELLPSRIYSTGELFLTEIFEQNNIKFTREKTFDDLVNISKLRYDFYLVDYNTVVEYHGGQHFDVNCKLYSESGIERDKLKCEYAKTHGINILYYTNETRTYEEFGYFTEVITDANILIQKIKEIGLTSQLNS